MDAIIRTTTRLRERLASMSALGWLITINIAIFIGLRLLAAMNIFTGDRSVEQAALAAVEMPASLGLLIQRPWTVVTYMFTQFDVFHIIFNMLWLFWFGRMLLDCCSPARLVRLYFAGGLVGAIFFIAAGALLPSVSAQAHLIGSSASVLAIVAATAMLMPNREVGLLFLGGVKLKWIALILIGFELVNLGFDNAGGNISHIGGALTGVVAALIFKHRSARQLQRLRESTMTDAQRLDMILDKIRQSGYGSLTRDERTTLFEISSRIK